MKYFTEAALSELLRNAWRDGYIVGISGDLNINDEECRPIPVDEEFIKQLVDSV